MRSARLSPAGPWWGLPERTARRPRRRWSRRRWRPPGGILRDSPAAVSLRGAGTRGWAAGTCSWSKRTRSPARSRRARRRRRSRGAWRPTTSKVACELGADLEACVAALARFAGVARRFERVGEARGVTVVDDYAHHPTEVRATLAAARQAFPRRRVVAVFQPHLYSRTALHGEALGRELAAADVVVVAPVYGAREQPIPGVTADLVARGAARAGATTVAVRERAALTERVAHTVRAGDVVFTLGAGDITGVGPELLQALGRGANGGGGGKGP